MSLLTNIYQKVNNKSNINVKHSLAENENHIKFWEDYILKLESLDFGVYANKLKVPTLVPVGNRIFFRGELKHTNELTVALGADYFAKCSLKNAEEIRQHRLKDAKEKLGIYRIEKEYLNDQLSFKFNKKNLLEAHQGHEIIEEYTLEEDTAWRKKHRENVRRYQQSKNKETDVPKEEIPDEKLWERLEELELQEELESELRSDSEDTSSDNDSFIVKDEFPEEVLVEDNTVIEKNENVKKIVTFKDTDKTVAQISKLDLLQQVIDKQNELEQRLMELKNKERVNSKTEEDLISKLDEMEMLDELEDEMERLEDVIESEEIVDNNSDTFPEKAKRRVSFADEDDGETLELTFEHSDIEPSDKPYCSDIGITKPSDIYEAYSNLFDTGTTSVLKKKTKYTDVEESFDSNIIVPDSIGTRKEVFEDSQNRTIVIKDIVEKDAQSIKKFDTDVRPTSLFKMRRQQKSKFKE